MARNGGINTFLVLARKDGVRVAFLTAIFHIKNILFKGGASICDKYAFLDIPESSWKEINYSDKSDKHILWFIPDFGIGSGGHNTIFRFVSLLEHQGIRSDICICGKSQWGSPDKVRAVIRNYFYPIDVNVFINSSDSSFNPKSSYEIGIATSWETAYFLRGADNVKSKFYFVQDFEPFFYPRNSEYFFAENTYKMGFKGITAGSWLQEKLYEDYGMNCISFDFGFDVNSFTTPKKVINKQKRLLFYARPPTERRGFEMGVLALQKVVEWNRDVEIVMLGWDIGGFTIPFPCQNLGVVPAGELPEIYATCQVGLVLSFTNLSLLPIELLAAGCEVVINKGRNNNWGDGGQGLFHYADTDPQSIADTIIQILNGDIPPVDVQKKDNFLSGKSWVKEGDKLGRYLKTFIDSSCDN